MKNSKILLSFLLVILIAISAGAVSAADDISDVIADSSDADEIVADSADVEEISVPEVDENLEVSDDVVVSAGEIVVSGNTSDDIQSAIDEAEDGQTINLGNDKNYNLEKTVTVNKKVNIIGNNVILLCNATSSPDNGYINVVKAGSGTTILGLTLKNVGSYVNTKYTGEDTIQGWGIYLRQATNCVIDNCTFYDWNHAVRIQQQANYNTVKNSFFYGGSATFINNLPNGPKDRGSYYVGIMGSTGCVVDNNTFIGPACDAVSIASGSGGNNVTNNYMEGMAYGIYFGGDSTKNTALTNNTFVKVGSFESDIYDKTTGEVKGHVKFIDLPIISVQKSADNFVVSGNTFYATTGNVLIAAQEGNTAHGYPSDMGSFSIVNNTVLPADDNVVMPTVVLCQIESNIGTLNPTGTITIANNTLNGAKTATYWSNEWGYNTGDVIIDAADKVVTVLSIDSIDYTKITGNLKDINGKALAGKTIVYTNHGVNGTVETDVDGIFTIEKPNELINITFEGEEQLAAANTVLNVNFTAPDATFIFIDSASKDKLVGSLKDAYGNPIANQKISFSIAGVNGTVETDANGAFTIEKPSGVVDMAFEGNENYTASKNSIEITSPQPIATVIDVASTFTRTAVDFPAGEKGYMFYFTLKDANGKVLANKAAKIGVSGKIYNVKTDANGKAGLMINLANANVYTYALSFLGDEDYAATFAVSKLTVVKKAVTITPAKTSYTFKASAKSKVITATLKSSNKYIPSGKKVTLTVGGKTYSATVGSNGKISLNMGAFKTKGTYKVTIKYAGDGTYKAATSKTITVKLS